MRGMLLQITEQVRDLQMSSSEQDDTLRLRKTVLDLLPDAANNISRLEVSCDACEQTLSPCIVKAFVFTFCRVSCCKYS